MGESVGLLWTMILHNYQKTQSDMYIAWRGHKVFEEYFVFVCFFNNCVISGRL